jgi:hypothetical protein
MAWSCYPIGLVTLSDSNHGSCSMCVPLIIFSRFVLNLKVFERNRHVLDEESSYLKYEVLASSPIDHINS